MRVLIDENTPFSFARILVGHECRHVIRLGWRGIQNGALLARAEKEGFDVLITLDSDMKGEQNMSGRKIAVLVMRPVEQGKAALKPIAELVLEALDSIRPGEIRVVEAQHEG